MAGLIPQAFIEDLLKRTDLVEVVSARVALKKNGKNYSACCPFHQEKTPSFNVSPDKQFYHCFGCGASGDALRFVMEHDRLDFPEAVELLARAAGLSVPREAGADPRERLTQESPLYGLLSMATQFYQQSLKQHPARQAAVDYLKKRGISPQMVQAFALGFAPPGWDNLHKLVQADQAKQQSLIEAGLLVHNEGSGKRYDRFRDRLMFPIRDHSGRVIGFGGRVLGDDKPKYLNSPETALFHKSHELYGLYELRQKPGKLDEILVVEGYLDVIALAQAGLCNAVATLGTATSEQHIKRLLRLAPSILFCFDGDSAGRKAAWRALEAALPALFDGKRTRFLFLPDGEDPDSLVRLEGADAFRARIEEQSLSLTDYFFSRLQQEVNLSSLEGKAQLVNLALPLLQKIPSASLQVLMRQRLAQLSGLALEQLNQLAQPNLPAKPQPPVAPERVPDPQEFSPPMLLDEPPPMGEESPPAWQPSRQKSIEVDPHSLALRTLLHYPELAQQVGTLEIIGHAEEAEEPAVRALLELLRALQQNPKLRPLQWLARWHGSSQGRLLKSLWEKEWMPHEHGYLEHNPGQQFLDTLAKLEHLARQKAQQQAYTQQITHLLQKNPSELSTEEKSLIQAHYRAQLTANKPVSAT
ncbi:DNA primase [Ventosimonas gracilis]|uniref:DNA primase n=1 Tax=Ventosimonas gracilis TaxID=1680762 RepID=A0A139SXS6_9GAMM|nr:DNA primase [Ventosimonas gracilis]KXU39418.1 DNA primase [Ventosimonas gracilis]